MNDKEDLWEGCGCFLVLLGIGLCIFLIGIAPAVSHWIESCRG